MTYHSPLFHFSVFVFSCFSLQHADLQLGHRKDVGEETLSIWIVPCDFTRLRWLKRPLEGPKVLVYLFIYEWFQLGALTNKKNHHPQKTTSTLYILQNKHPCLSIIFSMASSLLRSTRNARAPTSRALRSRGSCAAPPGTPSGAQVCGAALVF